MRLAAILLLATCPVTADEFYTLKGHGGPIMGIDVSPSGAVATASFDNSVGVWTDAKPQWLEEHRAAVNRVFYLPDGRLVSGGDDFAIVLWDNETAQRLEGHQGKVMGFDFLNSDNLLASASWDGSIGLWDFNGQPRFLTGHNASVTDVAFDQETGALYSSSADGTIRLWDPISGDEKQQVLRHGFGVNTLIVNGQEDWLAYGAVDGGTRVVRLSTGEIIGDFTLGRRPILALAYDPETNQIAVGDGEGYIMLLSTADWKITRDFRAARRGPIWALAFSADGQNILAGGIEDIAYSWPIDTMDQFEGMKQDTRSFLKDPDSMTNGERQFQRKCSICHSLTSGSQRKAGPSLFGLFGRKAGEVKDYKYSQTLTGSDIIWTEKTVDALFDVGPDHFIPGSKMPMQRITAQTDRDDLVAFLKRATQTGETE